jgi:plasmid stabilization system protein ParE
MLVGLQMGRLLQWMKFRARLRRAVELMVALPKMGKRRDIHSRTFLRYGRK